MNLHIHSEIEKENLYVVGQWWSAVTDNNKTIEVKNTANDTKVLLREKRTKGVNEALKTITTYNSALLGNSLTYLCTASVWMDNFLSFLFNLTHYHFSFWISSKQSSSIFNYWKFHCRQKILQHIQAYANPTPNLT